MTEVPEHLLQRSRERRAALGLGGGEAGEAAPAPDDASDETLQWCGRELERGFRARVFSAVDALGVLVDCDAHSLPGARFEPGELLVALLTEQAGDGSFGAAAEPGARVEPTLRGLHALVRFQR